MRPGRRNRGRCSVQGRSPLLQSFRARAWEVGVVVAVVEVAQAAKAGEGAEVAEVEEVWASAHLFRVQEEREEEACHLR